MFADEPQKHPPTSAPKLPRFGEEEKGGIKGEAKNTPMAVDRMGYPGTEMARGIGVTTSAVIRASHSEGMAGIRKYL